MENKDTCSLIGTVMNTESALQHIHSLVSQTRLVNITLEHKRAYRVLHQTINPSEDLLFDNNIPFANLYAHNLIQLANRYNVNIDNPILQRELHRIIDQPFHVSVELLATNMNDRLRSDLLDSIGYPNDKHPLMLNELEKEKILANLEKQLGLSCNYDAFMGNPWSTEEVDRGLKSAITKILA